MSRGILKSFLAAIVICVFTGPLLADGLMQRVSYSPDGISPATGPVIGAKKIRTACYPARSGCTKDSDCCSGHCMVNYRAAYCTK
jgi:hypothetical protein